MIREWLDEYNPRNHAEAENALREIIQEIALAGLARSGFFEKAAFYGGTALRIFHGVKRFSEDLDFSLLESSKDFRFQTYLDGMLEEFHALGMDIEVKGKTKTVQTAIESAFLKPDTTWKELVFKGIIPQEKVSLRPDIKIKLEVDTDPPPGFVTEEKLLLKPFSFYTKCFSTPDLFAGKMHALLFRKWKGRTKGRDWFDMEWYIRNNIPLHFEHFLVRARQSGDWKKETMTVAEFNALINEKIDQVFIADIRDDITRFIPDIQPIEIWSKNYFKDLAGRIIFLEN